MPSTKKVQLVQELTEKFKKVKSLVLTDYSGLSVPQQQTLRSKLKETGAEFVVVKNTLLKLALQAATHLPHSLLQAVQDLQGPTAALFSFEDELAPIRILVEFIEEFELPKIKIGLLEGKTRGKEEILELAKIPFRKELLARLVFLLKGPVNGLFLTLSGNFRSLVFVLSQIKKEGGEN